MLGRDSYGCVANKRKTASRVSIPEFSLLPLLPTLLPTATPTSPSWAPTPMPTSLPSAPPTAGPTLSAMPTLLPTLSLLLLMLPPGEVLRPLLKHPLRIPLPMLPPPWAGPPPPRAM